VKQLRTERVKLEKRFRASGFVCMMVSREGIVNCYIRLPHHHPWCGADVDTMRTNVENVTWTSNRDPMTGKSRGFWWIGLYATGSINDIDRECRLLAHHAREAQRRQELRSS
jgi:hypothetical protein